MSKKSNIAIEFEKSMTESYPNICLETTDSECSVYAQGSVRMAFDLFKEGFICKSRLDSQGSKY